MNADGVQFGLSAIPTGGARNQFDNASDAIEGTSYPAKEAQNITYHQHIPELAATLDDQGAPSTPVNEAQFFMSRASESSAASSLHSLPTQDHALEARTTNTIC